MARACVRIQTQYVGATGPDRLRLPRTRPYPAVHVSTGPFSPCPGPFAGYVIAASPIRSNICGIWGARLAPASRRPTHARAYQVLREGALADGQWRLVRVQQPQQDCAEPVVHAEVVRQASAQVLPEDQTAARLAARDRFALPGLHA